MLDTRRDWLCMRSLRLRTAWRTRYKLFNSFSVDFISFIIAATAIIVNEKIVCGRTGGADSV